MESPNIDQQLAKQVNAYLNHYVVVMDAKAVAVSTTSLAALGFLLSEDSLVQANSASWSQILSASSLIIGSGAALLCIFPRAPSSGRGHIFWGDITNFSSPLEYWKSTKGLTEEDVAIEMARQNYNVSQVLRSKSRLVRIAIAALGVAVVFQILHAVVG